MPSPFSSNVRYLGRPQGMQITSRFSPSLPYADDALDVHQALAVMNRSQLDGRESGFNFSGALSPGPGSASWISGCTICTYLNFPASCRRASWPAVLTNGEIHSHCLTPTLYLLYFATLTAYRP